MRTEEEIREYLRIVRGIGLAVEVLEAFGAFPLKENPDKWEGFQKGMITFAEYVLNDKED